MDSGEWTNPVGPFLTWIVNLIPSILSSNMEILNLPSFEILHDSSVDWSVKVFCGIGFGSQTSPIWSPSKSLWSGLYVLGQLSFSLKIPSLSKSSDNISRVRFAVNDWELLSAVISKSYEPDCSSAPTLRVTVTFPSVLIFTVFDGSYVSVVRDGRFFTEKVVSSLNPPLIS